MKTQSILVIGASGTVGAEVSRILKAQGHKVLEATSKRAPADGKVFVDLTTGEGISAAFEHVDRAFLLSPPGYADQYAMLSPLIQEAKRRGLRKVVLMTALGANASDSTPFRRAELELERSGLSYNIIRPNWFMQNFNSFWIQGIKEHGKVFLPAGTAKVGFIDARDISAVAAKLLVSEELSNRAFDLTGPRALDHAEAAELISKATGKTIGYQEITPEAFRSGLLGAGLPADYVDFMVLIIGFLREGYNSAVTQNVEAILGRSAIPFETYAKDFKISYL